MIEMTVDPIPVDGPELRLLSSHLKVVFLIFIIHKSFFSLSLLSLFPLSFSFSFWSS